MYVGAGLGEGFGVSVDLLPNPSARAERAWEGGGSLRGGKETEFSSSVFATGLGGILGGPLDLGGILGGKSRSTTGGCLRITGADLVCFIEVLNLQL